MKKLVSLKVVEYDNHYNIDGFDYPKIIMNHTQDFQGTRSNSKIPFKIYGYSDTHVYYKSDSSDNWVHGFKHGNLTRRHLHISAGYWGCKGWDKNVIRLNDDTIDKLKNTIDQLEKQLLELGID